MAVYLEEQQRLSLPIVLAAEIDAFNNSVAAGSADYIGATQAYDALVGKISQGKKVTDDSLAVELQHLLAFLNEWWRQYTWLVISEASLNEHQKRLAPVLGDLSKWLENKRTPLSDEYSLSQRSLFFAQAVPGIKQAKVLSYISTWYGLALNQEGTPAASSTIAAELQRVGVALKANGVEFQQTPKGYQYELSLTEATYQESYDAKSGKATAWIELSPTVAAPRSGSGASLTLYQQWAEVAVLAKIALLRAMYEDLSDADFNALLKTLTVENAPNSSSGSDRAYCEALDQAYHRYGFNVPTIASAPVDLNLGATIEQPDSHLELGASITSP